MTPSHGIFRIFAFIVILFGLHSTAICDQTADEARLHDQLRQVREQIARLQGEMRRVRESRDQELGELGKIEKEIGAVSLEIQESDRELAALEAQAARLESEQRQLEADLSGQREALEAQLRSAYVLGSQPRLKLLLSQSDASALGRNMVYFGYYNRARLEQISHVETQLARLAVIKREVSKAREQLKQTRELQQSQRQAKQHALVRRQQVIDTLVRQMEHQQSRLARLGQDQQHTQSLLAALRDIFADIPPELTDRPFANLLGTLSWPSPGTLSLRPGQRKPNGMNLQGTLIVAPLGTPVHTISHGRIAYADWLRGFGLLTIVDHGDGYLSLYGFNESLLRGVGDWVMPGEVIAAVGNSGGRDTPALYFELRKDGEPVDPRPWMNSSRPPAE